MTSEELDLVTKSKEEVKRKMTTYWITPENPPEHLVDAWEALHESFGTEPFSRRQGLAVLMKRYPELASSNLERVLDGLARNGNLGVSEGEF